MTGTFRRAGFPPALGREVRPSGSRRDCRRPFKEKAAWKRVDLFEKPKIKRKSPPTHAAQGDITKK